VIIWTLSAITRGIVRDLLTGQPPAVFTGQFYALAAIAGIGLYALLIRTSVSASLAWWRSPVYALYSDWTIAIIGPTKRS
jgi:uncharacterized membrane protein YeiH